MKQLHGYITEKATSLFSNGIKSIAMDDIALSCGISKKTLYQFFENKEMLVMKIIENLVMKNEQVVRVGQSISPNAASELVFFFNYVQNSLNLLTPIFLRDVHKFYPAEEKMLIHSKNDFLIPYFKQNILRGIKEEIYRKDLDCDTASQIYFWQLKNAIEEASVLENERCKLVKDTNKMFLHGIMSLKGKKLLLEK